MESITVYFDYLCPYAKRGMELASMIQEHLKLSFNWKHYSLAQGSYQENDGWQLWQDKLNESSKNGSKGLLPFLASYAVEQQNDEYKNFRLKMFQSYHDEGQAYSLENLVKLAEASGLNKDQFEKDLHSQAARDTLEQDHTEAISKNISATPTFYFKSGAAAYFRFKTLPQTTEEATQFFLDYRNIIESYPDLETIRRPYKRN